MEVMTDYLKTEGAMTVTELEAAKRYFGSLTDPWNKVCRLTSVEDRKDPNRSHKSPQIGYSPF